MILHQILQVELLSVDFRVLELQSVNDELRFFARRLPAQLEPFEGAFGARGFIVSIL